LGGALHVPYPKKRSELSHGLKCTQNFGCGGFATAPGKRFGPWLSGNSGSRGNVLRKGKCVWPMALRQLCDGPAEGPEATPPPGNSRFVTSETHTRPTLDTAMLTLETATVDKRRRWLQWLQMTYSQFLLEEYARSEGALPPPAPEEHSSRSWLRASKNYHNSVRAFMGKARACPLKVYSRCLACGKFVSYLTLYQHQQTFLK
jgi:hypothetical protein